MQTSFHDFYATCQENEENGAENLRLEILSSLKMHAFDRVSNYRREWEVQWYSKKKERVIAMFDIFGTEMDFQSKLCLSLELENLERKWENGAENLRLEIFSLLLKCMLLIESVIIKENEKDNGILSKRSKLLQCLTFFFGLR